MEQEPVYVDSNKLRNVCLNVLGKIYDYRQTQKESYVNERVVEYNQNIQSKNRWRSWFRGFGIKPKMMITQWGMENQLKAEIESLYARDKDLARSHPMVEIFNSYGDLEHQAKDCIIQCEMNESVAVSSDLARGISHLGLPLDFMRRRTIGFLSR